MGRGAVAAVLALAAAARALDNGVGLTPAMGWNSWNRFRCEGMNEDLIKEVARAMVSSGLREAGYTFVNVDDCWQERRGADGHIVPFASKFPSGMKALGDFIHGLGLKFGIYSCAGNTTCEGWPGSFGHEAMDAADYASWGVDYLKYDYCGFEKIADRGADPKRYYSLMRDALNATGRPIVFSLCNWGGGGPHMWGAGVGNSWRTGRDLFATWDEHACRSELMLPGFLQSIETAIETQRSMAPYAGPGGFNDLDMLVVGLEGMTPYGVVDACPPHLPAGSCKKGDYVSREAWGSVGGLTHTEQRSHFAFWCLLASPLMLGNDPRQMSDATLAILTAPELLAISQDRLARQATRVHHDAAAKFSVWARELADGSHALLLFNGGARPADLTAVWSRDLPVAASAHTRVVPREPPCADKPVDAEACKGWAKSGECERNGGFMTSHCAASCAACPPARYEGAVARALVRNAWERSYAGLHTALYTARHVEPHEARVLVVRFEAPDGTPNERAALERRVDDEKRERAQRQLSGAGGAHAARRLPAVHGAGPLWPGAGARLVLPPTLAACGNEHVDSLLLLGVATTACIGLLYSCMGRAVRRELGRGMLTPARGKNRPHAV